MDKEWGWELPHPGFPSTLHDVYYFLKSLTLESVRVMVKYSVNFLKLLNY